MKLLQDFIDIFVQTVLIDVKYTGSKGSSVSDICKSWNLLKKELIIAIEMRKFDKSLHILKASRILQSWLKDLQLPTNLYKNELQDILKTLLQNLNSEHCEQKKIIFENLAHLMAHNESNKELIEKILALPFTQHIEISESNHVKETARSLDSATMLKCLEVLCEYGNVTDRLKILNTCIINCDTELSIGAVL